MSVNAQQPQGGPRGVDGVHARALAPGVQRIRLVHVLRHALYHHRRRRHDEHVCPRSKGAGLREIPSMGTRVPQVAGARAVVHIPAVGGIESTHHGVAEPVVTRGVWRICSRESQGARRQHRGRGSSDVGCVEYEQHRDAHGIRLVRASNEGGAAELARQDPVDRARPDRRPGDTLLVEPACLAKLRQQSASGTREKHPFHSDAPQCYRVVEAARREFERGRHCDPREQPRSVVGEDGV